MIDSVTLYRNCTWILKKLMKFPHTRDRAYQKRNSVRGNGLPVLLELLILSILLLFFPPQTAGAEEQIAHEYQIKTAFLYNFAHFVEWPAGAFSSPSSDFHICILGKDPFGEQIDAITRKPIGSHQINLSRIASVAAVQSTYDCHLLFIPRSEKDTIPQIVARLGKKPVLTVTDQENAAQSGVIITMTIIDEKVRFQINRKAAADVGIKISSKLLSLATKVVE